MSSGSGGQARIHRRLVVLASLSWLPLVAPSAPAVEVSGGAVVFATTTDNSGVESDFLEEQYNIRLSQRFTPYVSASLGYQYFEFTTKPMEGPESYRRNQEPRVDLNYVRELFSFRLSYVERTNEGTLAGSDFNSNQFAARLAWKPHRSLGLNLAYRNEANAADATVFGRDTESEYLTGELFYQRKWGRLGYLFGRNNLENLASGLQFLQYRNELRIDTGWSFLDRTMHLNFTTGATRLDSKTQTDGSMIAEPVPAVDGLFAVDTSPEIGTLPSQPQLIDGDLTTPVTPPIDIGGGNTFRNIGVDLGLSVPVSIMEIGVNTQSAPGLRWNVYVSQDNATWTAVGGVTSRFDEVFLRYTIFFPETTARYFKAVNISTNGQPTVLVTEARALIEVVSPADPPQRSETTTMLWRADVITRYNPSPRLFASVTAGYTSDEDVVAGFTRREFQAVRASAGINYLATPRLRGRLGARYDDSENLRTPVLFRTILTYGGGLTWNPLTTVDVDLSIGRRDESDKDDLIQRSRVARLAVVLQLLEDMRLSTDVNYQHLEDALAGFDRAGWGWRGTLDTRPARSWDLTFVYGEQFQEARGDGVDLDRANLEVRTRWTATPYLSFAGSWIYQRDNETQNDRRNLGVNYSPGPKLSFNASYQETMTRNGPATETTSGSVSYRLNRWLALFGNLTRSMTRQAGETTFDVTSGRVGLRFFF